MWVKRVFRIVPDLKGLLWKALFTVIAIEALKLVPPYLLKIAIDLLVKPNPVFDEILMYVGGVLLVSLVITVIENYFVKYTHKTMFFAETDILKKAQKKLLTLSMKYHTKQPTGGLVYLMNKGSARLAELVWFVQNQFMGAAIQIILTTILLLFVHFWAGLIFALFMPIVLFLVHRTAMKVQPYRQEYHKKFRDAAWEMNQSILNIHTVKDFVQEEKEIKKYSGLLNQYLKLGNVRIKIESNDNTIRDVVLNIARFSVLAYTVYLVIQGKMSPGTLVLFATLSEKVFSSLFRLSRLYSHLGDSMESIDQFSELFEENPDIQDHPYNISCPQVEGRVTFEDVSFEYNEGEPVLKNINLEIPPKKVFAFVGRSGAGKTTMTKLIGRHYDVTSGALKIDGIDVRNIKVAEYRRKIAVVTQDIEVFDASVRENVSYGRKASAEEIEKAAKMAHAHEFIKDLPKGYDTRIGERGIRLSGGQKQRIGIARALIMKPAVIIFDEATSSLDTESERLIQNALKKISKKQTMVIIAHRLSTIKNADIIVVFDEGKIVEKGNYNKLMQKKGLFARMRKLQSLGEIRD